MTDRAQRPHAPSEITDASFQRRIDLIAHTLRVAFGVAMLIAAWTTDVVGDQRVAFTAFMLLFFMPLSPVDFLLTPRFGGTRWFDGAIAAGHTVSVFAIAWLAPSARVLAMLGYLIILVTFAMNGGRIMGFVVSAFAIPLTIAAELLVEPSERLASINLAFFAFACVFVSIMIHELTAERAEKASALEHALATERRQRAQIQAAKSAQDRFVESVTHELRTPIAVVMGAVHLMGSDRIDDAQRAELVERAGARASDLARIVTQVTEYATLESGTGDPQVAPVDVAVRAAISNLDGNLDGHDVTVDCPSSCAAFVDPTSFEHVISLVLDNAAKFSEPGTAICVRATPSVDAQQVVITIADQGRGIHADDIEAVFEPFEQRGEMLPGTMGIGVGLALARQLCALNDGTVSLSSQPGSGTSVELRFPAAPAVATPDEPVDNPSR